MKEIKGENNLNNILNTTMLLNCRLQDHSDLKLNNGAPNGHINEEKLMKSRTIVQNFLNKLQRSSTYDGSCGDKNQADSYGRNEPSKPATFADKKIFQLNTNKNYSITTQNNTKTPPENNAFTPLKFEVNGAKKVEKSGVGSGVCYNRRARAYSRNNTINISETFKSNIGSDTHTIKGEVNDKNVGLDFRKNLREISSYEDGFENDKAKKINLGSEGNTTKFVILNNMLCKQAEENKCFKKIEDKGANDEYSIDIENKNESYDNSLAEETQAFRTSRIKRQNFRSYVRSHSNIEGLVDSKILKNKLPIDEKDGLFNDDSGDGFVGNNRSGLNVVSKNAPRDGNSEIFKSVVLPKYYESLRSGPINKNSNEVSVDNNINNENNKIVSNNKIKSTNDMKTNNNMKLNNNINNNDINHKNNINNNTNLHIDSLDKVMHNKVISTLNGFDKNIKNNCVINPHTRFAHAQDSSRKANKNEILVRNCSQYKVIEQTEKLIGINGHVENKFLSNRLENHSPTSESSSSPPPLPTSSPPPLSPTLSPPSLSPTSSTSSLSNTLQESQPPSFVSTLPSTLQCNHHTPIMLECIFKIKNLSVTWFKNSLKIHETNNIKLSLDSKVARLIIFDVTIDDVGCYKCEARNAYGSASTQTDLVMNNNHVNKEEKKQELLRSTDIPTRRRIREELVQLRKNADNIEKKTTSNTWHTSNKESPTNQFNDNVNSNNQSNLLRNDIKIHTNSNCDLNNNTISSHRFSASPPKSDINDANTTHGKAQNIEKLNAMNSSDGKLNECKPSRRELIRKRLEQARERMKQIDIEFRTEECLTTRNHRTELSSTLSLPASVAQTSTNAPKPPFNDHKTLSRQDDVYKGSNTKIPADDNPNMNDRQATSNHNKTTSNTNSSNGYNQLNECKENQWKVHYKNVSHNQPSTTAQQSPTPKLLAEKFSDLMKENEGTYGNVRVKTTEWNGNTGKKHHVAKTVSWTPACKGEASVQNKGSSFRTPAPLQRSASTIKQKLLQWCNIILRNYPGMHVSNFSTSWSDGMAFCAIIHYFLPEKIDFQNLDHNNHRHNFQLAFETAESCAGVLWLLDVQDMVETSCPDWKSVFMYVESLYRAFVINKAAEKYRKTNLSKES